MTDDVNLTPPEEANPAQPERHASPAQFEDDANPEQPEDAPADREPSAAGPEPAPDPAAERDEYRDLLLRKQAEFDNYKKRIERDRAKANRQAEKALIMALLPLLDDFERALGTPAGASDSGAYRAGVELIHRRLLDVLRRRGVAPIDTAGARFDPNLHEAVAYQTSQGHADGDVVDEVRRGYLLDEELLRAAMVRVAKA